MFKFCCKEEGNHSYTHTSTNNSVYGIGGIGAAIYYIGTATTFWGGVLGLLKACVWPAFLVYEALKALGA